MRARPGAVFHAKGLDRVLLAATTVSAASFLPQKTIEDPPGATGPAPHDRLEPNGNRGSATACIVKRGRIYLFSSKIFPPNAFGIVKRDRIRHLLLANLLGLKSPCTSSNETEFT